MCGICGIYNLDDNQPVQHPILHRMARVLSHRGPDDEGFFIRKNVGLGHRRLNIIDLDAGSQPMFNETGDVAIVFNGEIYNFKILRQRLEQKGHRFKTRSDTECIVHGYEEWGTTVVNKLRGMFAFAIWDGRKRQLFLARDRVGIKPLYYYWDGKKLIFASEIKAILQHPDVQRELNPFALDDYLTYLYIPAPRTIFKRIHKLRPGHFLTVSDNGLTQREYWDLSFESEDGLSEAEYAAGLLDKIKESVSIRLVSDVPLGAFLSGGIDSSAVVGVMSHLTNEPVNTASIGFCESNFDELPYARIAAEKFKTRMYEKTVEANAANILDRLVWHFDEPFADSSMVPTYYVSQVARDVVTVCLSGDGGDENFAGYRRYRFDVFENRIRSMLHESLRRPLFGTLGRLYPKADWLPRMMRGKTLLTNLSHTSEQAYHRTMSWFDPAMKGLIYTEFLKGELGDYDPFSVMKKYFDRTEGWDPLSRIQYVDIKTYLVDDILTKVDRASMAHSLEVRVPLLDHELMEYAASIPGSLKLRRGEGKYIFKKSLADLLPPEVSNRPKMGFSIPLAQWLRGDLKNVFEDRVLSKDAFIGDIFNQHSIRRWWIHHQRGIRDYSYHLWALLILESWGRKFLDDDLTVQIEHSHDVYAPALIT